MKTTGKFRKIGGRLRTVRKASLLPGNKEVKTPAQNWRFF